MDEAAGFKFDWIASKTANFTLCIVDADKIPQAILQQAKGTAAGLLGIEGGVDKIFEDFPHHLDGGWPDVHPHEMCVSYAQIRKCHSEAFRGTSASAMGSSKKKREQGVALALVVAACVEKPGAIGDKELRDHFEELPSWIGESSLLFNDLRIRTEDAAGLPPSGSDRKPASDGVPRRSRGSLEEDLKEERMINAELRAKLKEAEAKLLQVSTHLEQPTRDLDKLAKRAAGLSADLLHATAKIRSVV